MLRRLGWVLAAGAIALTACSKKPVSVAEGRGAAISYTCLGCHGIPNYKNAYPNYSVPKLTGQHADYLVVALQAYRSGERAHATMHAQASSLTEQDMKDIATFFSGEPLKSDGAKEGEMPAAGQTCVACHGEDGVGITPIYPTLSGQHADYLARALLEYKEGTRKNPIMAPFAQQLSREQIEALAEYYARQKPALATVERNLSASR